MIRYSLILFTILFSSCLARNIKYIEKMKFNFTEPELNLVIAFELLKQKHPKCKGDCNFSIESHFSYFDTCAIVFLDHIPLKMNHFKKSIEVPIGNYYINGFGTVKVFHHIDKTVPDFLFSPIYFYPKSNELYGQLKYKDGKREEFSFNIIDNQYYFWSSQFYFNNNCNLDFDSF